MQSIFHTHSIKIVTAVLIVIGLSVVVLFFLIFPQIDSLTRFEERIHKARAESDELARDIADYRELLEKLSQVEEYRGAVSDLFPEREDMVALIIGLEDSYLATAFDKLEFAIVDSVEMAQASNGGGSALPSTRVVSGLKQVEEIPYTLTVQNGTYRDLVNFMLYAENLPFITEFDSLTISADALESSAAQNTPAVNSGTATVTIKGVFFTSIDTGN